MATGIEIAIIVLSSLSLCASLITPLVGATALFINRITKSKCFDSEIDLQDATPEQINNANKSAKTQAEQINNAIKLTQSSKVI